MNPKHHQLTCFHTQMELQQLVQLGEHCGKRRGNKVRGTPKEDETNNHHKAIQKPAIQKANNKHT